MGLDGKLGAFVTHVIKGGPADMANIMECKFIPCREVSPLKSAHSPSSLSSGPDLRVGRKQLGRCHL